MLKINNMYRIGEMSKIHKISIKTLRYYDEQGLFVPTYISPDTGYRYYSVYQFDRLRLIKFMKSLGLSLDEIKNQLNSLNAEQYMTALRKQCTLLEEKIQSEILVKHFIEQRISDIENARNAEKNRAFIEFLPEQRIIFYPRKISSRDDFEKAVLDFQTQYKFELRIERLGQVLSVENLKSGIFNVFCGLQLQADENNKYKGNVSKIPAGHFATIYYSRVTDDSDPYWFKLLEEVKNSSFEVSGNAVRTIILEKGIGVVGDDYLACIRIPVKYVDASESTSKR